MRCSSSAAAEGNGGVSRGDRRAEVSRFPFILPAVADAEVVEAHWLGN